MDREYRMHGGKEKYVKSLVGKSGRKSMTYKPKDKEDISINKLNYKQINKRKKQNFNMIKLKIARQSTKPNNDTRL